VKEGKEKKPQQFIINLRGWYCTSESFVFPPTLSGRVRGTEAAILSRKGFVPGVRGRHCPTYICTHVYALAMGRYNTYAYDVQR
jgi:hypothetical protein